MEYKVNDTKLIASTFISFVNQIWQGNYDMERTQAALSKTLNITAYDNKMLVGCLRILTDGYFFGTITELLVLPEYQKQGVGSKLLELAKENTPTMLYFGAQPGIEAFYEKNGCQKSLQSYMIDKAEKKVGASMAYFKYQDKSVFYEEYGQGEPVIFLHGNTASSKMSELLMPLYVENFRCILIDFLGNGQSDRVEKFSPDMWHDEALQTIALTEHLQCGKVSLVGTSGGAWAAVNAALERPDLFQAVVADSFDGRTLNENFSVHLLSERKTAKDDTQSRQFYEWCQGADWEKVVDLDTEALLKCAEEKRPLFHKPLEELKTPILFMGSREDESCRNNMEEEYREMASMLSQSSVYLFPSGGHPSLFSNAEQSATLIKKFISQYITE